MSNPLELHKNQLIFHSTDGAVHMGVTLKNDSVWLNLNQISELFHRDKSVIAKHIKKVWKEKELEKNETVAFFATVQKEGSKKVSRNMEYFNLDMILSVGYRVNSKRGTEFRRWSSFGQMQRQADFLRQFLVTNTPSPPSSLRRQGSIYSSRRRGSRKITIQNIRSFLLKLWVDPCMRRESLGPCLRRGDGEIGGRSL